MKKVTHEIAPPETDAMGSSRLVKISIPAPGEANIEDIIDNFEANKAAVEQIFERLRSEQPADQPTSARDALTYASKFSDPDAPHLSEERYFFAVEQGLENALEILEHLPDRTQIEVEQLLNLAFHAGSNFRTATMRRRHLTDIKREAGNAKARSAGGKAKASLLRDENEELFKFMDERIGKKKRAVKEAARFAARKGVGAKKGTEEQRTEANRQRYIHRQKSKK